MTEPTKPTVYREVIDALVNVCRSGQGQIGPRRVRAGLWNQNATPTFIPDQYAVNELLSRLGPKDREVVARMLEEEFQGGVFEALKVLEEFKIDPFQEGYEGSPFHDFVGRLAGWEWPEV